MIDEATKCGLRVNQATVNQLAWGIQRKGSPYSYVVPDVRGELHTSLQGAWWILEYLPKSAKYKEWPARKAHFGCYIPDAEPPTPDGAMIHKSAVLRIDAMPSYGGRMAEAFREVPDAGSAGACVRGSGRERVGLGFW